MQSSERRSTMERFGGAAHAARSSARPAGLLMAAAALLAVLGAAQARPGTHLPSGARLPGAITNELPGNQLSNTIRVRNKAEAKVAERLLAAIADVSEEIVTGVPTPDRVEAMDTEFPMYVEDTNLTDVTTKVLASALATWQLGVWDSPTNKGLRPKRFNFYGRDHYYQIPKDPIGTFVMFHGCYHDASGSWPYDPENCPECLGLPEEVAHTKQALRYGFAVLAVESKNRSQHGRCFSSSSDPLTSDQWEAPYIIQNFLYENSLQNKPVYVMGISAGAAFAVKIPKAFYAENFGGVVNIDGVISEVNAVSWQSWGLVHADGTFRFPGFPPVAFISMVKDTSTAKLINESVTNLRAYGVNSDWIDVEERPIKPYFFYFRSPVITPKQSATIVAALKELGFIDENGMLTDDPRVGHGTKGSPLAQWNRRLIEKLPWLHMDPSKPPMLSVLSDRSTIFEQMNLAFAWHEGIADHVSSCLVWLQSGGKLDLKELDKELRQKNLRYLTMDRVYPAPPPPPSGGRRKNNRGKNRNRNKNRTKRRDAKAPPPSKATRAVQAPSPPASPKASRRAKAL